jgi:hypothetical protein
LNDTVFISPAAPPPPSLVTFACPPLNQLLSTKARITLRAKSLYAADGRAVKELLKLATLLYEYVTLQSELAAPRVVVDASVSHSMFSYPMILTRAQMLMRTALSCLLLCGTVSLRLCSAMRANKASLKDTEKPVDADAAVDTDVPHDIVATRAIAAEITTRGAKLYDLLKEEQTLRDARNKALRFLDAIAGNLDSRAEHSHLERSIRDAIAAVQDNVASLEKQVADLQSDQRGIDRKLKKAQQELERSEKRMKSLQTVR